MPENNEPQYELDKDYAPLGIVDAADGSGTTWPEFVGQVDKMDNQVAALTENWDSQSQKLFEGDWSSGSVNIPTPSEHTPILVYISGGSVLYGTLSASMINASATVMTSSGNPQIIAFGASGVNGVYTWNNMKAWTTSSGVFSTNDHVVRITTIPS